MVFYHTDFFKTSVKKCLLSETIWFLKPLHKATCPFQRIFPTPLVLMPDYLPGIRLNTAGYRLDSHLRRTSQQRNTCLVATDLSANQGCDCFTSVTCAAAKPSASATLVRPTVPVTHLILKTDVQR